MRELFNNRKFLLFLRAIIALIFIFAGIEKIGNPESFGVSIENYKILPVAVINLIAIPLPWIELITGLLLLFGITVKENIVIISSLLIIFIILVLSAVLRGLDIDCGCFGTLDGQKVGLQKIAENLVLLGIGCLVYLYDKAPIRIDE